MKEFGDFRVFKFTLNIMLIMFLLVVKEATYKQNKSTYTLKKFPLIVEGMLCDFRLFKVPTLNHK